MYKLLSIILAFTAWMYVQGGQVAEVKVRSTVDWTLAEGVAPVEPLPQAVNLTLRGTRASIRNASRHALRIDADLRTAKPGEHRVEFDSFSVRELPNNVTITSWQPDSISVHLDRQAVRRVRLEANLRGEPAAGHVVSSKRVEPEYIRVRGPRSLLDNVSTVQTRPIDIAGLQNDIEQTTELTLPWGVSTVESKDYRALITLSALVESRRYDRVRVLATNGRWKPAVSEVSLTLQGPAEQLERLNSQSMVVVVDVDAAQAAPLLTAEYGAKGIPSIRVIHPGSGNVKTVSMEPKTIQLRPQ